MTSYALRSHSVDAYLRNTLTADEEAEFEMKLLASPELQDELETAMAVRRAIELDNQVRQHPGPVARLGLNKTGHWQPLAMAASVVLALFSTIMYWRVGNEAAGLQNEIALLKQPHTSVLTVPVEIMRSAGSQTPDVIIHKPGAGQLLALDVELSAAVRALDQIRLALRDGQNVELLAWTSRAEDDGRLTAVFDTRQLPLGKVWLEMSNMNGEIIDRRLLEFR